MTTRKLIIVTASALIAATGLIGATTPSGAAAVAGSGSARAARNAAAEAREATQDLAHHHAAAAVSHAEHAVQLSPQDASYRMLLGQSYLRAGRFVSARNALNDALSLDPANGRAALNLALARIATGDWAGARQTLDTHADTIPVSDRGLAMALAGDPVSAVDLLTAAARSTTSDAKTRQNLALSLALAGRWQDARAIAALDVSPADVDRRLLQWASFVRPHAASDQVAALLGVTAVEDGGQPAALALAQGPVAAGPVAAAPVAVSVPDGAATTVTQDPPAAQPVAAQSLAPVAAVAAAPVAGSAVRFGPRQEVVQSAPVEVASAMPVTTRPEVRAASHAPTRGAAAPAAAGHFYVQVGAYENAAVARDAWSRFRAGHAIFAAYRPQGAIVTSATGRFYRLSVGGFSRADAKRMCGSYRQGGGRCFVRSAAGDQVASWSSPIRTVQLASR